MNIKESYGHFINGTFLDPKSGTFIESINPHNETVVAKIASGSKHDVNLAIEAAKEAAKSWSVMRALERGKIITKVADALRHHMEELIELESAEMGMPKASVKESLITAANYLNYYGGLAPSIEGETFPMGESTLGYTLYESYGVVGVITPWNAPLNQTTRSLGPALAVGNTVVHKPSEHTSLTALRMAELAVEAGLPAGVWNVVTGYGADVGAVIVEHPDIRKVSFTGSVSTGKLIAKIAAEKIMPVTLELGGKSPNIVFEDADLDKAVPGVLMGFVGNSGQVCSAGTRILIQKSIYEKFTEKIAKAAASVKLGIEHESPTIGPLANKDQFQKVKGYYKLAKEEGAVALTGGEAVDGTGYYVKPTVYTHVDMSMRIANEEIFGPVGVCIPFDTEEEAIDIANQTDYGLAAGIWSQNISRVHRVAAKIQAGQIFVNSYYDSGVEAPFGGYKKSGLGREKGKIAMKNYLQIKSVIVKL